MRGIIRDRDLGSVEDMLAAAGAAGDYDQLRILVGRHSEKPAGLAESAGGPARRGYDLPGFVA